MERRIIELVWQQAYARCEYCQLAQAHSLLPFEIDHIIAKKHGGATAPENLCLACYYCNCRQSSTCRNRSAVSLSFPNGHPRE